MMTSSASIESNSYISVNMTEQEQHAREPSLPMRTIANTTCSIRSACRGVSHWMWKNKGKFALGALCMAGSFMGSLLGTNQANAALAKKVDDIGHKLNLLGDSFTLNFSGISEEEKQDMFATTTMQTPIQSADVTENTEKCKDKQYYVFEYDGSDFERHPNFRSFGVGYYSNDNTFQPVVTHEVTIGKPFSCYVEVDGGIPSSKIPYSILNKNDSSLYEAFTDVMGKNNIVTVVAKKRSKVNIIELFDLPADCSSIREELEPSCENDRIIWGE